MTRISLIVFLSLLTSAATSWGAHFGLASRAQSFVPAAAATTFYSPTNLGAIYWWNADSLASSPVTTWTDAVRGSNAYNILTPGWGTWTNGKTAVFFTNGTSQCMTGNLASLAQPFTIFAVCSVNNAQNQGYLLDAAVNSSRVAIAQALGGNAFRWGMYAGSTVVECPGNSPSNGNWQTVCIVVSNAASVLYTNGVPCQTNNPGASSLTSFTMGNRFSHDFVLGAALGQMTVFPSNLTGSNVLNVHRYFSNYYAIAAP